MEQPINGRLEGQASNHKIVGEFPIYLLGGRYCGMITALETFAGLRWSHSIQRHGTPLFQTSDAATADFEATKQRLPAAIHAIIFGA